MQSIKHASVPDYIASFPPATRAILKEIRRTVKAIAPDAEEVISYNMPAYKQDGILVYFAAYKRHIGLYPIPATIKAFEKDLSAYKTAKGSVQFPIDQPLPLTLIEKIVKYRLAQNAKKLKNKNK